MKTVILAGGFGTRISEESSLRPKPMLEIGGMPILWHIMKEYSYYGFNEFVICAGYKQHMIKQWFSEYFLHTSDITFDFTRDEDQVIVHRKYTEPWKVTVVDTGLNTMTGGRIKRIRPYIGNERFFMTYGDGVADIDLKALLDHHIASGRKATLTATELIQRFGVLDLDDEKGVRAFKEKVSDGTRINVGYMVLEPEVFDYIEGDDTVFEKEPMERLAEEGDLTAYFHNGFWQCMDTKREKDKLEEMWAAGNAPWKLWKD
ncbi:MAG: glucose-1-phosphate cytidylyltransferase [Lachnospiraceae bacterium]|nr:glucose-1-phosphate cytidylyltransferase [Lachnospiraceae bacterium]